MISKCTLDHAPLTAFSSSVCHQETELIIVRNIHDKEVLYTTYIAHGGAIALMILERKDKTGSYFRSKFSKTCRCQASP